MNDKSLGYAIIGFSALLMIIYFAWFFAPALGSAMSWLAPYAEWAYRLPILAMVYLVLFIVFWIGYTVATTPPTTQLDLAGEGDEAEQKEK